MTEAVEYPLEIPVEMAIMVGEEAYKYLIDKIMKLDEEVNVEWIEKYFREGLKKE